MHDVLANILSQLPEKLKDEQFTELLTAPDLRIERIVSTGHRTPSGEWLEQNQNEWVLLIQGEAALRLENFPEALHLRQGDYVLIAAGQRHRVEWTSSVPPTVWLAVHYD